MHLLWSCVTSNAPHWFEQDTLQGVWVSVVQGDLVYRVESPWTHVKLHCRPRSMCCISFSLELSGSRRFARWTTPNLWEITIWFLFEVVSSVAQWFEEFHWGWTILAWFHVLYYGFEQLWKSWTTHEKLCHDALERMCGAIDPHTWEIILYYMILVPSGVQWFEEV